MATEIVEAVARAICLDDDQVRCEQVCIPTAEGHCHYESNARAALTVALDMMREPSGDMIDCAVWKLDGRGEEAAIKDAVTAWQAMHAQLRKEILT